jgi:flagellar protein FlbD
MQPTGMNTQTQAKEGRGFPGGSSGFFHHLLNAFTMSAADPFSPMISLTRLNGQPFVVNADKIRYVEQTPDTLICCDNGEKMMVKESLQEVMRRAIDYARIIRKAIVE